MKRASEQYGSQGVRDAPKPYEDKDCTSCILSALWCYS